MDEQKAKMPPPPPDSSNTVLIDGGNKEIVMSNDDAIAAAAAVVDASVTYSASGHTSGSALVADPTAGSYCCEMDDDTGLIEPI